LFVAPKCGRNEFECSAQDDIFYFLTRFVVERAMAVALRAISEQAGLFAGWGEVEVFVGQSCGDAAAGGAVEEANLDEEGFVDFF
jgi:hypothetical protein